MKRAPEEERMTALCRDRGLPVTPQRRAVLRALAGRRDHPTAEQVHAAAASRLPGMTRATVYRALEALEGLGVVRKVDHAGAAARYEVDTGPHHHLACDACGRIADVHDPALEGLALPAGKTTGFTVREYSIQFRGICASCKGRERRKR
jgi:Fur family transcriptional regulator, peroxide stress response regulator